MSNKLIEIGSRANVILRFRTETKVNEETYLPNEPYLLFKNANVLVEYNNLDKSGSAGRTVIAGSYINPKSVSIGNISLTRKLVSLLTTLQGVEENFGITQFQTSTPEEVNGTKQIILNNNILENTENKIFVYEEDTFNKIDFIFESNPDRVEAQDFDLNTSYLVSYEKPLSGLKFNLKKNPIPYFSLEIQGIGNVNKMKKNVIMYFDKVSLNTTIDFTFIQDEIIKVPLSFHIIENENNYVWIEE